MAAATPATGAGPRPLLTDVGPVGIKVPRDASGTFEPQIVREWQWRLTGVEVRVLALSVKGLMYGEIAARVAEVCGADVSEQTISTIAGQVLDGVAGWRGRRLGCVYPVLFVGAACFIRHSVGGGCNRP